MRSLLVCSLFAAGAFSLMVGCAANDDDTASSEDDIRNARSAQEGATCGNGFFGTPKVDCASGLVCVFPDSTAPTGPAGSSSALAGTCKKAGAREGETCGTGFFGTPNIACAAGLECVYPDSTAPTGPAGSSSALPGKCKQAGALEGETCGNGFFGTPNIDCASGLVCKYPSSTAPTGPNGSSSALAGKCETP